MEGMDGVGDLSLSLPDEILEKILALLPISVIFRARAVCRRWNAITSSSPRFFSSCSSVASSSSSCSQPWYFMFKESGNTQGFVYDPSSKKWHNFTLLSHDFNPGSPNGSTAISPHATTNGASFVAYSNGLACFADTSQGRLGLYLLNPMTKECKKVPEEEEEGHVSSHHHRSERWASDNYYAISIKVDGSRISIVVASSSQVSPDDYSRWRLTIDVFETFSSVSHNTSRWRTAVSKVLDGWRGGENSAICDDTFYCVVHSTSMLGAQHDHDRPRHALVSYKLSPLSANECETGSGKSDCLGLGLARSIGFLPMPCPLTCAKLMNCDEKLIMVGGIGKSDVVKGIGVWQLTAGHGGIEGEWMEVSRMPNKFFRGFGEFDDVFSSSGTKSLVYIHAFGSPQLLIFGVEDRTWRWSQKCPMVKKHPLHLFTGFCFEPRLGCIPLGLKNA